MVGQEAVKEPRTNAAITTLLLFSASLQGVCGVYTAILEPIWSVGNLTTISRACLTARLPREN